MGLAKFIITTIFLLTTYLAGHLRHMALILFKLMQHQQTYNSLSYEIEKADDNDTLHITGYRHGPKFEVARLVDFKKIK